MSEWLTFKSVSSIRDPQASDTLETSVLGWAQWSFLGIGAFGNVTIPSSGSFGGQQHKLRAVRDPYLTNGRAWEGFRSDWVWETGVPYSSQPIRISGVNVNSVFYPTATTTGTYKHHIEYPLGRVVFDNAISTTGLVTLEYSYRTVRLATANAPWFQEVQYNSYRVDDGQYLVQGSGAWNVLAQNRVQLPALVVEVVPNVRMKPYELGTTNRIQQQDVLFHVIGETKWDRDQLHDIMVSQWEKSFFGIDKTALLAANRFPLDVNGTPVSGALMYPSIVAETGAYRWKMITVTNVRSEPQDYDPPLWGATVRATCEMRLP